MTKDAEPRHDYDDLNACVAQELGRWTVPGAVVGIYQDGDARTLGAGVTSLETRQPVTPETLFQLGSISKLYTATLVMRLVEADTLDLDTPVTEYLPELRLADEQAQRTITLRHLLTHASGLEGDRFTDYGLGDDALTRAIAEFSTLRQLTPPGELWTYGNSGFYLVGRVVEVVTGKPFEAAMRELLFEPLGLEHSFFFAHEAIVYPVAVGHKQRRSSTAPAVARTYSLPRVVNAAGGIISTVGDLLRFAALHLHRGELDGHRLLSETSVRAMQTPQIRAANFAEAYGIGWALRTMCGEPIVEHGGTTIGFQAQLTLVPSQGLAVASLTNGARGRAANHAIHDWALAHLRGLRREELERIQLSTEELSVLAGRYENPRTKLTITVQDGTLRVELVSIDLESGTQETQPPLTLIPIGPREFVMAEAEYAGLRTDFIPGNRDGGPPRFIRFGGRLADRVD